LKPRFTVGLLAPSLAHISFWLIEAVPVSGSLRYSSWSRTRRPAVKPLFHAFR
jgi:hypothetical protein